MQFSMIAATDVGNSRTENEDSLRIVPHLQFAVVADGMGGHKAGEIASRMAVNSLTNFFEEQYLVSSDVSQIDHRKLLLEAITIANAEVYSNGRRLSHLEGMGTTLVASCFRESRITIGHIGDSRCYRFSCGELAQLTEDHTLAQDLMSDGSGSPVPAYSHHVLKKALGIESRCEPDIITSEVLPKDIFLMCSDGLNGVVDDADISTILALRAHEPELCMDTLIRACLMGGAPDNVSVVLVFAH